jgi:molybdopterin converting factor small subunit
VFGKGLVRLELDHSATFGDALRELDRIFGVEFEKKTGSKFQKALESTFILFLNGIRRYVPNDLEQKLKDGDELVSVLVWML